MAETTTAAANEPVAATSGGEARTAPQGGMAIPFGAIPPEPTLEAVDGIRFDFNDGLRVKLPEGAKPYLIRFYDLENKFTAFESVTPAGGGGTALSTKRYFVRWRLTVADPATGRELFRHDYDAKDRVVAIRFPVHTLGDTIAWFSYVEKFRLKHKCKLYCAVSPWFAEIVKKQYPEIRFVTREEAEKLSPYANYNLGLYELGNSSHQVFDHRYVGLHKVAAYMLGVDPEEEPPRFDLSAKRTIKEKYVCIAVQSTSLAKMWNHPMGWRLVVEHLKRRGYRVLCVDRESFTGKNGTYTYMPPNAEDFTGSRPLQERIDLIKNADFFIGLSSGLSWLRVGVQSADRADLGLHRAVERISYPVPDLQPERLSRLLERFQDLRSFRLLALPEVSGRRAAVRVLGDDLAGKGDRSRR